MRSEAARARDARKKKAWWGRLRAEGVCPFRVRLDAEMRAALEARSGRRGCSLHEQILTYIEWGLEMDNG